MKKFIISLCMVFGSVYTFSQTITLTPERVDSLVTVLGNLSPAKPFVISGTGLTGNIVIPGTYSDWEFSLSNSPFLQSTASIVLTAVAGVVPPTTVYVRLRGFYFYPIALMWDQIPIQSGALIKQLMVTGAVMNFEPTVQSTISFGDITDSSIVVNTNGGNGMYKLLVAKESSPVDAVPQDIHYYYGGRFGNGSYLGNGNFVVSSYGFTTGISTVTGLVSNRTYYFAVFDYSVAPNAAPPYMDNPGTENYLLPGNTGNATTLRIGSPLPILINYITGTRQTGKNLLNWKVTCISTPRVTMVLERSADSRNFTGINSITADAVRCNQPFDYVDTDPLAGMNYYRLKMIDADGKISYSGIVALLNAVKGFDIISIAPNPVVNDNLNLNVASAQAGKMEIVIFDMQGRLVNRQALSVIAGFNSLPVNAANLSAGIYTISGSMAGDKTRNMRFVKQ